MIMISMSKLFEGKVAVITGGSSGIGRATALAFAAEGARVAIGARRAAESEETIRQIEAQGGEAIFVSTDVSRADQVQKLMDNGRELLGSPSTSPSTMPESGAARSSRLPITRSRSGMR